MKYDKNYWIFAIKCRESKDDSRTYLERSYVRSVKGHEFKLNKKIFFYKDYYDRYILVDKSSGKELRMEYTFKKLKEWYLNGGRTAYNNVIKNNLNNYVRDKNVFKQLVKEATL